MAPRRLIPATTVARWERELRAAADKAMAEMHGHVRSNLAMHGVKIPSALVAATKKQVATGVGVGIGLGVTVWKSAQWSAAVRANVQATADRIATEAVAAAQAAVPVAATWGMPSTAPAISAALMSQVSASGAYLGDRLNTNVAASTDPAQAAEDVFDTSDDIVGGQLGASAEMSSNFATSSVSSYLNLTDPTSDATSTWNCIAGESLVAAPEAWAVARRWYEGPIVNLRTRSGRVLAITPDHPVMTSRGWTKASELHEGDNLIGYRFGHGAVGSGPHIERPQPSIEECFKTASLRSSYLRVARYVPDLDGHGEECEIHVVPTDRELADRLVSPLDEPATKGLLALTDEGIDALLSDGSGFEDGIGTHPASQGPTTLYRIAHRSLRFTHPSPLARLAERSSRFSSLLEATRDHRLGDPEIVRDPVSRLPLPIETDYLVSVDIGSTCRYVFDLSTVGGWFVANGLVIHNSVGDDRTREDHLDADGQEVAIGQPFEVGGEFLMFPGDPSGSDAQTISCRCWLTQDGIDPGVGEGIVTDDQDPTQGLENILNRAGTSSPTPISPRSYPN